MKGKSNHPNRKAIITGFLSWDQSKLAQHTYELMQIIETQKREITNLNERIDALIDIKEKKRKSLLTGKYNAEWPYLKKIYFILIIFNRPVQVDEIIAFLNVNDYHFKSVKKKPNTIYGLLNRAHKKNQITSIVINSITKKFYVLREWLDEDGNLRKEYLDKVELF